MTKDHHINLIEQKVKEVQRRSVKKWKLLIIKIFLPASNRTFKLNALLLLCQHKACPSSFFSTLPHLSWAFLCIMYLLMLFYSCFFSLCTPLFVSLLSDFNVFFSLFLLFCG